MSDSLLARLEAVRLSEPSTIARNRAIAAARASSTPGPATKPARWRYLAALAAVGLIALSPLGASVASSLGDLVGIGEEPTNPIDLGDGHSEQAVVGVGEAAPGVPYELATTDGPAGDNGAVGQATCFFVSLPTLEDRTRSASCLTAAALRELEREPIGSLFAQRAPAGLGPSADIVVTGAVADRVARLEVEYPGEEGPTSRELDLAPFEASPLVPGGVERSADPVPLSAFAAFLPFEFDPAIPIGENSARDLQENMAAIREAGREYQRELSEITLRAYDETGAEIATASPGSVASMGSAASNGMSLAIGIG